MYVRDLVSAADMRLVCVTDGSTTAEGDLDQQRFLVRVPQMRDPFHINFYQTFVVYFSIRVNYIKYI